MRGQHERGALTARMLGERVGCVAVHVERVGVEHEPWAGRAEVRDDRGSAAARPEAGTCDDGVDTVERERMDRVGVHAAVRVGRQPDGHERRVERGDLGADRFGHGEGDESCPGGERTATGEHGGACGADASGDDEHDTAAALLVVRVARGRSRAVGRERPPASTRRGRMRVDGVGEARAEASDVDRAAVRGARREQEATLERTEGDGRVGDDRAVAHRAVIRPDTGRDVAGDDERTTCACGSDPGGGLRDGAAERAARTGAEQAVDDDVGPRTAVLRDEDRGHGARPYEPAHGEPVRSRTARRVGGRGVDAVGRDHPDVCAPCGEQRCRRPAVAPVVAASDDEVDP